MILIESEIYKNNLSIRLKEYRMKKNKIEYGLKDRMNNILHNFDMKREIWNGGIINGVNCRRLMKIMVEL